MKVTSSGSSDSASKSTPSPSPASDSSTKSESTPKSTPSESTTFSAEAQHDNDEGNFDSNHFSALASNFGESLPSAFCAVPEGTQVAAHGDISAGMDLGPISGEAKAALGVTVASNKALVTPSGNTVDTELRTAIGLGTEMNLDLRSSSMDNKTAGIGNSWQATLPQGLVAGCADPNNAQSWTPGTDLSFTQDQFQQAQQEKTLGPLSASTTVETRQGDMEGITKDGNSVLTYKGQVNSELVSQEAGINWGQKGSLELVPGSAIKGQFGLQFAFGRTDSLEHFSGPFSEMDPSGVQKEGILERTTYQSGVGFTAAVSAGAEANINGWTVGGDASLGGTIMGNGTYQKVTTKTYADSPAQVLTDVYAETQNQRQSEFVQTTDDQGGVTQTQTVTMATDPSYQNLWKDTFGPETKFQGENVILTLTDQMAQEFSTLAQQRLGTPMGDVFSQASDARGLAQALTENTNYGNNHILETLFTWQSLAKE